MSVAAVCASCALSVIQTHLYSPGVSTAADAIILVFYWPSVFAIYHFTLLHYGEASNALMWENVYLSLYLSSYHWINVATRLVRLVIFLLLLGTTSSKSLTAVTHAQETCIKNLHRIKRCSIWYVYLVQVSCTCVTPTRQGWKKTRFFRKSF